MRKLMLPMFIMWVVLLGPGVRWAQGQFLTSPYFEKVKRGEPLVVALHQDSPPFCLVDSQGVPRGIDVEIARRLADVLQAELTFVYPEFKDIIGLVADGSVDLAISNLTITVPRAAKVAFSHSYLVISQGALLDRRYIPREIVEGVVRDVKIESFADLEKIPGLVYGTWGFSTSADSFAELAPGTRRHIYPDISSCREALHAGLINIMVADSPIITFIANHFSADRKRFKVLTRDSRPERLAIALHMGDPSFTEFLNEFVDELKADGSLDLWLRQYLDDTSWAPEVLR